MNPTANLNPRSTPCRRFAGTIKWFSADKGYGFIVADEGPELYVHRSGLALKLPLPAAGDRVEFSTVQGERSLKAARLVITQSVKPTTPNRK